MKTTVNGLEVTISEKNIHIKDSYSIRKRSEMRPILREIDEIADDCSIDCPTNHRTENSMVREWVAHNNLYRFGIYRSHTKDVDLDYPQKWYMSVGYFLLSIIAI